MTMVFFGSLRLHCKAVSLFRVHGPRAQRGFTLLEALVAMVIAAMALGALYRTVGQSSKNVVDVESRVEAALIARSVLALATYAEDFDRQPTGQVGPWYWGVQVTPEKVVVSEIGGRSGGGPLAAARITIHIMRAKEGPAVVTWTTWKPYRAAQ